MGLLRHTITGLQARFVSNHNKAIVMQCCHNSGHPGVTGEWLQRRGPGQSKLTITRSNRGYLRLGHTDNWHETEPGAATEVTQIYAQYFIQLDKYLATKSWKS